MQSNSEKRTEMFDTIITGRWIKLQLTTWSSAEQQWAALTCLGVDADVRTIQKWRQGQLPSNKHKIQLMLAGFSWMLDQAFEPAAAAGRLSELEARIEQQEAAIRADREELARIRQASSRQTH